MNRSTVALLVLTALVEAIPGAAQQPKIVRVADRSVEVIEMGTGAPTFILESGAGDDASVWSGVLPALAVHTHVIAYSRAGYGQSSAAAGPSSFQTTVQQLHELLAVLGEHRPVVIVGHSLGGLLARLYASLYPRDVAGLVLIDGTHEQQWQRWDSLRPSSRLFDEMRTMLSKMPPGAARDDMEQMLAVQTNGRVDRMRHLPDVPLAVITALKPCPPEREWVCRDPQALEVWRALHAEWAAQSTNSIHIVSARTEHYVMKDQPDLVAQAVRFVMNATRNAAR